jgi:hypothetical protein
MQRNRYLVAYDICHPRRLDPRMKPRTLGIARPPADPAFFFVG